MFPFRVFVDANVLYSRTLRDWLALLQLRSDGEIYSVYWSEDVLCEAIYHLRRKHPGWDGAKITRIRDLHVRVFEHGRVDDFTVDGSFPGRDGNDRHVHAAALACTADVILTCDGGFSTGDAASDSLPYEVYRPDEFFVLVDDSAPDAVRRVTREQTEYWYRRCGRAALTEHLMNANCPEFAQRVVAHQTQLSLPS